MTISITEILQYSISIVLAAGLVWALWITLRHHQAGEYPQLLKRMLRHLGVEFKSENQLIYKLHLPTAVRVCRACTSKAECEAWLQQHPRAEQVPEFCANAAYLQVVTRG